VCDVTAEWLVEQGFKSGSMQGVYERSLGDPKKKNSQPAFIQIEILKERVSASIHLGKGYRMIDVKTCGDVLRVIEVFEGVKT
jgi:hypothetical protein